MEESLNSSTHKTFMGVRFLLRGFDPPNERMVRSKLVNNGGFDVSLCTQECTHVIVDKLVYDDPSCVAARNDGKILVSSLWVDHSYDTGILADVSSIMYRPLKDLNGIPGAKHIVVCLTGYMRQEREDIMTMVGLMGAVFSKPLVAAKVTHLVCYKFEGEKYELAKKMKTIKLINHWWLHDCLRAWEIVPESNYSKCTYELEMMEAEAKDSDEEENIPLNQTARIVKGDPCNLQVEMPTGIASTLPAKSSLTNDAKGLIQTSINDNTCDHTAYFNTVNNNQSCLPDDPETTVPSNCTGGKHSDQLDKTPLPIRPGYPSVSTPGGAEKYLQSGSANSKAATCYSRKSQIKSTLPIYSEGALNIANRSLDAEIVEHRVKKEVVSSMKSSPLGFLASHEEEFSDILPRKRKADVPYSSSKSPKTCHDFDSRGLENSSASVRMQVSVDAGLKSDQLVNDIPLPFCDPKNLKVALTNSPSPPPIKLCEKPSSLDKKYSMPKTMTSEKNAFEIITPSSAAEGCTTGRSPNLICKIGDEQNMQHNVRRLSLNKETGIDKSSGLADPFMQKGENNNLISQQYKRSSVVKRTPVEGNISSIGKQKGSLFSNISDAGILDSGVEGDTESNVKLCDDGDKFQVSHVDEVVTEMEREKNENAETESPNEETEGVEKSVVAHEVDVMIEDKVEGLHDDVEAERAACEKKDANAKSSVLKRNARKEIKRGGKERDFCKTKSKTLPSESNKVVIKESVENSIEVRSGVPNPAGNMEDSAKLIIKKVDDFEGVKKENMSRSQSRSRGKQCIEKMITEPKMRPKEFICEANKKVNSKHRVVVSNSMKAEPVWFVVSGHRLQRKEFEVVIKRLKGRLCRDSHRWSYKATHFVASDPIRRTEKFFAAAASGRWILKTDYLSASNEAGKFVSEEPYEWHKHGLSEDGAINMEAPRKWRLVRERTGHGAFYGMRFIIYGECIVPSLETLKRVVKAGDGEVLATAPPYNRPLKSGGVDFAIVSSSMPSVDVWVQEFLRHGVACVAPDYLVEYVCKPEYCLEKHVLYKTRVFAETSLAKMQRKMLVSDDDDDVACAVCGCGDRAEAMLICGDQSGRVGCGIATHMDCCRPALEGVPMEDWFCSGCIKQVSKQQCGTKRKRSN